MAKKTYSGQHENRGEREAGDKDSNDGGLTRSERRRIQAAGTGIVISRNRLGGAGAVELRRNRLGGAGAVELRRGNRLDVFGGLGEGFFAPTDYTDYFDLSPTDEAAADKLTASLVAPSTVQPFRPFSISWGVTEPGGGGALASELLSGERG